MPRITIELDSATADQARELVLSFQRTRDVGEPLVGQTEPTIRMMGIGWGITLPPMCGERAAAIVADADFTSQSWQTKPGMAPEAVLEAASSLLDGADPEDVNPEYVRALAELVCDLSRTSMDDKESVAEMLWERSKSRRSNA